MIKILGTDKIYVKCHKLTSDHHVIGSVVTYMTTFYPK